MTHTIKRGDRYPPLVMTLGHEGEEPLDLTGATLRFVMRRQRGPKVIDRELSPSALDDLTVTVEWLDGETDTAGVFRAEVEATFPNGVPATWPNTGHLLVHIVEDLGGAA